MNTLRSLLSCLLCLVILSLFAPAAWAAKATARVGQTVTLTVTADGTQPFGYEWRLAGAAVSTATVNPLVISSVQVADGGDWDVIVSNSAGSATSDKASLTVFDVPTFTLQPASQVVAPGAAVTLTVAASNQVSTTTETVTLTYQWLKGGAPIAGATAASYVITAAAAADVGSYTCLATTTVGNAGGAALTSSATSAPATITLEVVRPTIRGPLQISVQ